MKVMLLGILNFPHLFRWGILPDFKLLFLIKRTQQIELFDCFLKFKFQSFFNLTIFSVLMKSYVIFHLLTIKGFQDYFLWSRALRHADWKSLSNSTRQLKFDATILLVSIVFMTLLFFLKLFLIKLIQFYTIYAIRKRVLILTFGNWEFSLFHSFEVLKFQFLLFVDTLKTLS